MRENQNQHMSSVFFPNSANYPLHYFIIPDTVVCLLGNSSVWIFVYLSHLGAVGSAITWQTEGCVFETRLESDFFCFHRT